MQTSNHFKIVKLKTGETILCSMENDVRTMVSEPYIRMHEPVQVIPQRETRRGNNVIGETFVLRPWIGLSDSDEFTISSDVVLTIGNLKREVKQQYVDYITQAHETRQRLEDSNAAHELLCEVTPGEVNIIDLEWEDEYYENQENDERQ